MPSICHCLLYPRGIFITIYAHRLGQVSHFRRFVFTGGDPAALRRVDGTCSHIRFTTL